MSRIFGAALGSARTTQTDRQQTTENKTLLLQKVGFLIGSISFNSGGSLFWNRPMPLLTVLTPEQVACLLVAKSRFGRGVQSQSTIDSYGDVGQVSQRSGIMTHGDVSGGWSASGDGIEKICLNRGHVRFARSKA